MQVSVLCIVILLHQITQILTQEDHSTVPPGPGCYCVFFYQCKDGSIITDGRGIVSPRSRKLKSCALDDQESCGRFHVCCCPRGSNISYVHKCGVRKSPGITSRIAGETSATKFGEWPWQGVILQHIDESKELFKCSCVLISERYALTVAHCVEKFRHEQPSTLFVRLGVWDVQDEHSSQYHQDMVISRIKIHPRFDNETLVNDIALLKFKRSVKYHPHVDTICLPFRNESHVNQTCVVTGWGKEAWGGSEYSRYLKKASVPVLNHTYCQQQLRKTRLGSYFVLHKRFICAGGTKEDACKGDGGGPLVCPRKDGTYSLTGIVSWGIECGTEGVPGVYVNVRKYLRWIRSVTKRPIEHF